MFRRIARKSEQEGQAMVETALMILVVLLLLMGIIEFGFLFYAYVRVSNAAREGARAGSLWLMHQYNPTLCEQVQQSVWSEFPAVEDAGTVAITLPDGDVDCSDSPTLEAGGPITVTVSYDYDLPLISDLPIIKDIISSPYPVSRTVVMRVQ
jgi:Flp pilus assembly protein TadG